MLCFLLPPAAARAADSSLRWRTLDAGRVRVHYHQGCEEVARQAAVGALEALDVLVPRLGWRPDVPIELLVRDTTDSANGSANVVPYNRVMLFPRPPEVHSGLADHEDWIRALVLHEVAHVIHLGRTGGLPGVVNMLLGRTLAPNFQLPPLFIEGVAVYEETDRTAAGRARTSLVDMMMRAEALHRGLPDIDHVTTDPRTWPGGFSRYFYGGRFLTWLARARGEAGLARFIEDYGDRLLPYSVNTSASRAWDETVLDLWDAWRREETDRAVALAARRAVAGLTHSERLTRHGYEARSLRLSPDGRTLLYRRSGGDVLARLVLLPLDGQGRPAGPQRPLVRTGSAGSCAWDPTDGSIVFTRRERHRQFYSFNDLFRLDPATGDEERLTHGLRARDPDVASDGRLAFVVGSTVGSDVVVADREAGKRRVLALPGVREVDGPRWSPDGRWIAVSGWRHGGERDLYLLDPAGERAPRRVTRDRALDIDAAWSADGRQVLFASDRGGVFDVFAYDLEADVVRRVTRLSTGGFDPVPGPGWLLFAGYGPEGFDVHRAPLVPDGAPAPPGDGPLRPAVAVSEVVAEGLEDEPYAPWRTLHPRAWFPVLGMANGGSTYGLIVGGRDVVGHHSWLLSAELGGARAEDLHFLVDYLYDRLYPRVGVTVTRTVRDSDHWLYAAGHYQPYRDERITLSAGASLPFSGAFLSHRLSLRYSLELLRPLGDAGPVEHDPWVRSPAYPRAGVLSGVRVSWRLYELERPTLAVSPEEGRSLALALRYRHPVFLSEEESVRLTWALAQFVAMPWGDHHALQLSVRGGMGTGGAYTRRRFRLGGIPDRELIESVLDELYVGGGYLRGYPPGVMSGDTQHLLGTEYRLPLVSVLRGIFTLPMYLDRVFAAAFADCGTAVRGPVELDDFRLGVGGELRAELVLGYFVPVGLRLGVARGVSEGGITQTYLRAGHVF